MARYGPESDLDDVSDVNVNVDDDVDVDVMANWGQIDDEGKQGKPLYHLANLLARCVLAFGMMMMPTKMVMITMLTATAATTKMMMMMLIQVKLANLLARYSPIGCGLLHV